MPDAQCTRSPAGRKQATPVVTVATGLPEHPAFPHTMVLTGYFVLSPVIRIWLTPSSADNSTDLTPTSRRQDHTTSPSASGAFVKGAIRVHRIPFRVRDDREPPLCGTGQ